MAGGVSKYYEREWVYQPGGDRFEDRVGKILSQGKNLQETFREQAITAAKKARAFENEQTANAHDIKPANTEFYEQANQGPPPSVDKRGMVWVTPEGQFIAPASDEEFNQLPPPPTPKQTMVTDRQKFMANLDPAQRSKYLWRTINPACMEVNTKLPVSTNTDFYKWQPELMDPLQKDKRFNRQKTDFTSYADQKLRYEPNARK